MITVIFQRVQVSLDLFNMIVISVLVLPVVPCLILSSIFSKFIMLKRIIHSKLVAFHVVGLVFFRLVVVAIHHAFFHIGAAATGTTLVILFDPLAIAVPLRTWRHRFRLLSYPIRSFVASRITRYILSVVSGAVTQRTAGWLPLRPLFPNGLIPRSMFSFFEKPPFFHQLCVDFVIFPLF